MSAGAEIDASHTQEITCPYCGHEKSDSWEVFGNDDGDTEMDCGECDKKFTVEINRTVTYSSRKMDCEEGAHRYLPVHSWDTTQEDIERYKREGSCLAKYIKAPERTWQRKCGKCEDSEHETVAPGADCPERLVSLPAFDPDEP